MDGSSTSGTAAGGGTDDLLNVSSESPYPNVGAMDEESPHPPSGGYATIGIGRGGLLDGRDDDDDDDDGVGFVQSSPGSRRTRKFVVVFVSVLLFASACAAFYVHGGGGAKIKGYEYVDGELQPVLVDPPSTAASPAETKQANPLKPAVAKAKHPDEKQEKPKVKNKNKHTAKPTKSPTAEAPLGGEDDDDDDDGATAEQDDVFEELADVEEEIEDLADADDDFAEDEMEGLEELEGELVEVAIEKEVLEGSLDLDEGAELLEEMEDNADALDEEGFELEEEEEVEVEGSDVLRIPSSALVTIKKSNPDSKTGGMLHLSVQGDNGDERVSFVRFDLSSLSGTDAVARATLRLYLVTLDAGDGGDSGKFTVAVDALPHGGNWPEGTVSWNGQPAPRGSFRVGSFDAAGLPGNKKKKLYEVDVTPAIDPTKKRMTFKLYAESGGARVDFAGKTWRGGQAAPELVVSVSN